MEIYHNNLDLCSLIETWIKLNESTTPITSCPPGNKIFFLPRDDRVGGGVAVVHRGEIPVTHNVMYNCESMECSDFKVSLSSFNLYLAVIYQPPKKSVLAFTKDILDHMEKNINMMERHYSLATSTSKSLSPAAMTLSSLQNCLIGLG